MLIVNLTFFTIIFSMGSFGQSIQGRQYVANQIISIKKQQCKLESKAIQSMIELAATYIMHGERKDMTEKLKEALQKAKTKECKQSLKVFLK